MTNYNFALTESVSLRNQSLKDFSHEKALVTLNKAKALVTAFWQGENVATTAQIAEFYEVSEDTIRSALKNNRSELESDGLKIVRGKNLKEARSFIDLPSEGSQFAIWTPRSALRLGMLLRDSLVAKNVRDLVLDLVGAIPQNTPYSSPSRDALAYIEAATKLPELKVNPLLKQLLEDALTDDLELARNIKMLPGESKKNEYTIVKVRAKELGYDIDKIANGSGLGNYVARKIKSDFKKRIGEYNVHHYKITSELDDVIKSYFIK
jgi:hypothetical protein